MPSVAIVYRSDVYSDDPEYGPNDYRKAAYRQRTLWRCGYLGRRNRKVMPSCVVWDVRTKYPAPALLAKVSNEVQVNPWPSPHIPFITMQEPQYV